MIRELIITTLTGLALVALTLDVLSRVTRLEMPSQDSWTAEDGNLRFISIRDADPIEPDRQRRWNLFGLGYSDHILCVGGGCPAWRFRVTQARLPLWMPLVLFAAYPLVAFARGPLRRWRRRKRSGCRQCGYNLTGNVSGRCPECGATVKGDEDANA